MMAIFSEQAGPEDLGCHGVNLSDFQIAFFFSPDSPTGTGVRAGVWLPWQRLPQQRALPE